MKIYASKVLFSLLTISLLTSCSSFNTKDPISDLREQTNIRQGKNLSVPYSLEEATLAQERVNTLLTFPLNSESTVEIAILNNRHLRAELDNVGIAHAELLAATTWSNPSLGASVRFPSSGGSSNYEFGIAADVLNWILTPLRSKIAVKELEKVERRVSYEILSLSLETKAAFYEVQARESFIKKLTDIIESNKAAAEIAKRLHDAGNINDLQLLNQLVAVSQAQLDLKRSAAQAAKARAKLNRMMGLSKKNGNWTIDKNLPTLLTSDPELDQVTETAMEQRQDVVAARLQVAILEQALSLKRSTRLIPGVSLGVNTERDPNGTSVTGPQVELEVPIFNHGKPAIQKLESELKQAKALLEAKELEATNDVEAAFAALQTARAASSHISSNLLPQRQKILKQTLLQYNAMQMSNFDLLLAKQEHQHAEKEGIESLRDYWVAHSELEKAAGGSLLYKPIPISTQTSSVSIPVVDEHQSTEEQL